MSRSLVARLGAVALFALGGWMAYVRTQATPAGKLTLHKLAADLYEIEGEGGNVAFYVTTEGVILVDDKYERNFDGIAAQVKTITPLPIKYVLNTHHHGDHTGGNGRFLAVSQVISTANARANIVNDPSNAPPGMLTRVYEFGMRNLLPSRPWRNRFRLQPARLVFTQEADVVLGGNEVRALYFGRGHTNGDAVIYFPALRTIHMGDLMANDGPLIDYEHGGSLIEWVKTLDEALKLDFDTVIPGHGVVSNKAGLYAYRNYVDKVRDRLTGLIREGKGRDEVGHALAAEFGWAPNSLILQLSLSGMMREFSSP